MKKKTLHAGQQEVGRTLSRRIVTVTDDGAGVLESLDPDERLNLHRLKSQAVAVLREAGIQFEPLLVGALDARALVDHVRDSLDTPGTSLERAAKLLDSPAFIAARILDAVMWMENAPAMGAPLKSLLSRAYQLGRLSMLLKAYVGEDASQRKRSVKGAAALRQFTRQDRDQWWQLRANEFASHSDTRAAELIAQRLNLGSSKVSTIRAEFVRRNKARRIENG